MQKGKPCQPDMSLREEQQINLDTESATHTGMEGRLKSSQKYLLLQMWCGVLTVAMVVLAALVISIKPKSTEEEVSTLKPDNVRPTGPTGPTVNTFEAPLKSIGSSLSYIQLIKSLDNLSWQESPTRCHSCSLVLRNDSIHCLESSLYFIYAQVTFRKQQTTNGTKSVILKRNATFGKSMMRLVEGILDTTEGSVWVAKIVSLKEGDSVSLDTSGEFLQDSLSTFWGAYQLL